MLLPVVRHDHVGVLEGALRKDDVEFYVATEPLTYVGYHMNVRTMDCDERAGRSDATSGRLLVIVL